MGAKGQSSYRDPPFLPWGRKEESQGAIERSKRPGSPCQYLHWAKGPVQGRTSPRPWEEPSLAMDVAEDKGSSLLLVVTLRVIPQNRESTKTEKDNGKNGNI